MRSRYDTVHGISHSWNRCGWRWGPPILVSTTVLGPSALQPSTATQHRGELNIEMRHVGQGGPAAAATLAAVGAALAAACTAPELPKHPNPNMHMGVRVRACVCASERARPPARAAGALLAVADKKLASPPPSPSSGTCAAGVLLRGDLRSVRILPCSRTQPRLPARQRARKRERRAARPGRCALPTCASRSLGWSGCRPLGQTSPRRSEPGWSELTDT